MLEQSQDILNVFDVAEALFIGKNRVHYYIFLLCRYCSLQDIFLPYSSCYIWLYFPHNLHRCIKRFIDFYSADGIHITITTGFIH